jgi:hypothetical protein
MQHQPRDAMFLYARESWREPFHHARGVGGDDAVTRGACGGQSVLHRSRCYDTLGDALEGIEVSRNPSVVTRAVGKLFVVPGRGSASAGFGWATKL